MRKKKKYTAYWTTTAQEDLVSAMHYTSKILKTPIAAENLLGTIEKKFEVLEENPYLIPLSQDEYFAERGIRHLWIKNYFLFYTINEDAKAFTIIRMLHARRDWMKLFEESSQ